VIQHRIADPLAAKILQGNLLEGEHIVVDVVNGELQFTGVEVLEA